MVESDEEPRFRVRCRSCGRTMFSRAARIGEPEAQELREHLRLCRLDAVLDDLTTDLGTLLGYFDVQAADK
jgi:hypothetical protein